MSRPLTRTQALQNRAFLSVLRRTGNVRLACREVGLKYGTMQDRRRKHPAFALKWDAAVVFAQARLAKSGRLKPRSSGGLGPRLGPHQSTTSMGTLRGDDEKRAGPRPAPGNGSAYRTTGGEAVVVRLRNGTLQMRRAQPGKLTAAAEQAFLAALSVTCNVSLAAAAVGSCFNAFNRRRKKDPGFAREMRMALKQGWEALELGLLEAQVAGSHEHDDWRDNDPPAMPPMTVNQALQLMYLHQKAALQLDEPDYLKRRRGESNEAHSERLALMSEARDQRAREEFEVAEVERWQRGEPAWGPAGADVRAKLGLPDLAQVTGWSRADPAKAPHHEGVALFGGWRLEDMEEKLGSRFRGNDEPGE